MQINQQETASNSQASPFHPGEQDIQSRLGIRAQMERFGGKVIRDFMPEQHREFYAQLPFLIMGHCDKDGWPWASILAAPPGFVSSSDAQHLTIAAQPMNGDPLAHSLCPGQAIGVLGIEPHSKRRNRLSAVVDDYARSSEQGTFQLKVKQSFGNCPQYIQSRHSEVIAADSLTNKAIVPFTKLSTEAVDLIRNSDTFYVASSSGAGGNHHSASAGADASHRGGKPGFVSVDSSRLLTIPDYLGNNHFNTLGNFQVYPKAGLLFIDDRSRSVLMLTGTVEILWEHELQPHFDGAQRFWQFSLDHGIYLKNSLPLKTILKEFSPNTLLTGDWTSALAMKEADRLKAHWQAFRISGKVMESQSICSFFLTPETSAIPQFKAGQFISLQVMIDDKPVVRTYTVSSAPGAKEYRISVKRDEAGLVSRHLHDSCEVGRRVLIKAPQGQFTFDTTAVKPAVMLTAGIGITPVISMLHDALNDKIRRRHMRTIIVVATVRSDKDRAFAKELAGIEQQSGGDVRIVWAMTSPEQQLVPGHDFQHKGRLSAQLLQNMLPLDDYDFYLCGPDGFMHSTYDMLQQLGVGDSSIMAESFGPASLVRRAEAGRVLSTSAKTASQALVRIRNVAGEVQAEQQWAATDGSLLEFAEAHGLQPEFGCRNGHCGSCAGTLNQGSVTYDSGISAVVPEGTVLLCCAKPALDEDNDIATIDIQLSS